MCAHCDFFFFFSKRHFVETFNFILLVETLAARLFLQLLYLLPAYAAPIFRFSVSLSCLHDPAGSQLGLE